MDSMGRLYESETCSIHAVGVSLHAACVANMCIVFRLHRLFVQLYH